MPSNELKSILEAHRKYLAGEDGGSCADLSHANLRGADLRSADLRGADLRNADLSHTNTVPGRRSIHWVEKST